MENREKREYEKKIQELEKKISNMKYNIEENHKRELEISKNYLQLFGGYGSKGIRIPLDEEIKKEIGKYVFDKMNEILRNDKDIEDKFIKMALNYKNAFINIFKPIVKEMIEDLDFNVSFHSNEE